MTDKIEAVSLPLADIVPGNNDRTIFNEAELQDLAADILKNGLIQPITVRPWQGRYQIVAGERRYRAYQLAKLPAIPAYIKELTDEQADSIMLSENLSRKDLDPIEEGQAIRKRMDRYGWTVAQAAENLGISEGRVKNRIALLKLIWEAQHLVRGKHLPLGHAEAMQSLDKFHQLKALRILQGAKRTPNLSEWTAICGDLEAEQNQAGMFDSRPFLDRPIEPEPRPQGKTSLNNPPAPRDPQGAFDSAVYEVPVDYWIRKIDSRQRRAFSIRLFGISIDIVLTWIAA